MKPSRPAGSSCTIRSIFTLIELLIVSAIIVILMSLLLPSLRKSKEYAKQINCANNLKQLGNAMLYYVDDYRGWLPNYNWWVLRSYFPPLSTTSYSKDAFHCPSHISPGPTAAYYYMSYAINSNIGYCGAATDHHGMIEKVKRPSMSVLLGENGEENIAGAHDVKNTTVTLRHNAGANYLFVDIHVKWFRYANDPQISWAGFY